MSRFFSVGRRARVRMYCKIQDKSPKATTAEPRTHRKLYKKATISFADFKQHDPKRTDLRTPAKRKAATTKDPPETGRRCSDFFQSGGCSDNECTAKYTTKAPKAFPPKPETTEYSAKQRQGENRCLQQNRWNQRMICKLQDKSYNNKGPDSCLKRLVRSQAAFLSVQDRICCACHMFVPRRLQQ